MAFLLVPAVIPITVTKGTTPFLCYETCWLTTSDRFKQVV